MKMPTERQLRNLMRRVCSDFELEEPELIFQGGEHAHSNSHKRQIVMPSHEWVSQYRATNAMGYRLLMLHELAHWAMGKPGVGGVGHTPQFYHLLFHFCVAYEVPIDFALQDEIAYKPRAARAGFKLWVDGLYDLEPGQKLELKVA